MTFRELVIYSQRRFLARLRPHSEILSLLHTISVVNCRLHSKSKPDFRSPSDFNPFIKKKPEEHGMKGVDTIDDLIQFGDRAVRFMGGAR